MKLKSIIGCMGAALTGLLFLSCGVVPGSPGIATEVKLITLDPAHFVNWRDPPASHLLGILLCEHQSERAIREWEAVRRSAALCAGRHPAQQSAVQSDAGGHGHFEPAGPL